jgi:hypothetical protein
MADGRAVPGITVVLDCEAGDAETVRADLEGRFRFKGFVPSRNCKVRLPGTRYEEKVQVGRNLMRGAAEAFLRVVYPQRQGVKFNVSWSEGKKQKEATIEVLDGLAGVTVSKAGAKGVFRHPRTGEAVDFFVATGDNKMAVVIDKKHGLKADGATLIQRAVTPRQLRGTPSAEDISTLIVAKGSQLTKLVSLLGKRTLAWVGPCSRFDMSTKQDLQSLGLRYGQVGLRTVALVSGDCGGNGMSITGKDARVYIGNDAHWALQVGKDSSALLVLQQNGQVVYRSTGAKPAVDPAVVFLQRSWPVFAATQRVSVKASRSVSKARVNRLMGQAGKLAKAGKLKEAHAMLDTVIGLAPTHAEARKQRALMKASLGDVCGAMSEVGWWRDEFGDDSADDLLDEVRKRSKR